MKLEKNQKISNAENPLQKPEFFGLIKNFISDLPKRSQDIIEKRFGLLSEESETLEKIGKDYKITRERVRQIITDAVKIIPAITAIGEAIVSSTLSTHGM